MNARRSGWLGHFGFALLATAFAPMFAHATATDEIELLEDSAERVTEERDLARDRFEVNQADVKDLVRRRLQAIRDCCLARFEEYRAGRGTLDSLRATQRSLAHARQPLSIRADVNREALESLWRSVWRTENLARSQYAAGQIKAADYFETLYFLLDTEVNLVLSRPKNPKKK